MAHEKILSHDFHYFFMKTVDNLCIVLYNKNHVAMTRIDHLSNSYWGSHLNRWLSLFWSSHVVFLTASCDLSCQFYSSIPSLLARRQHGRLSFCLQEIIPYVATIHAFKEITRRYPQGDISGGLTRYCAGVY